MTTSGNKAMKTRILCLCK